LTLVEMMVGIALGLLLLAAVATLYIVCLKSFASMTNYAELNGKNRFASDILTRDIRNAAAVTDLTTNQLILHYPAGDVTYTFDGGTLTRSQFETNLLLSGITSISFSLYQRWTTNQAYEVFPPATPATAKLVGFEWTCWRPVYGSPLHNSLTLQGAIVKLRNK
jgi:hypothetical protein